MHIAFQMAASRLTHPETAKPSPMCGFRGESLAVSMNLYKLR